MKHIIPLVLFTCLIMTGTAFAQETVVPPNQIDALTLAIDNAAEGDVLVLERGGIYPVSAQLIVDTELTLKAADGDSFKPVVVRLAKEDGTYPNPQFSISASFTVQNIKFTGAQATAPVSNRLLTATKIPKLHLDGVVVTKYQQVMWPDPDSLIIENCLFSANINTPGGWGFIVGGQRKTLCCFGCFLDH